MEQFPNIIDLENGDQNRYDAENDVVVLDEIGVVLLESLVTDHHLIIKLEMIINLIDSMSGGHQRILNVFGDLMMRVEGFQRIFHLFRIIKLQIQVDFHRPPSVHTNLICSIFSCVVLHMGVTVSTRPIGKVTTWRGHTELHWIPGVEAHETRVKVSKEGGLLWWITKKELLPGPPHTKTDGLPPHARHIFIAHPGATLLGGLRPQKSLDLCVEIRGKIDKSIDHNTTISQSWVVPCHRRSEPLSNGLG